MSVRKHLPFSSVIQSIHLAILNSSPYIFFNRASKNSSKCAPPVLPLRRRPKRGSGSSSGTERILSLKMCPVFTLDPSSIGLNGKRIDFISAALPLGFQIPENSPGSWKNKMHRPYGQRFTWMSTHIPLFRACSVLSSSSLRFSFLSISEMQYEQKRN